MTEKEAAQRCATASRYTVDDWHPVVHDWWAAGHSLDGLVEWIERDGTPPGMVAASLHLINQGRDAALAFEQAIDNLTGVMESSRVSMADIEWPDGDPGR